MTRVETVIRYCPDALFRWGKRGDPALARARGVRANLAWLAATALAAACGCGGNALAAPTLSVIHSFANLRGNGPLGALIADGAGNVYGTTQYGGVDDDGVVFELSPPAPGKKAWTEKVLLTFRGANGYRPDAGVVADGVGNLYGTTPYDGANDCGLVFELSPPAAGKTAWTEKVLFSFNGLDGNLAQTGVIADSAGNLYGTTQAGGSNNDGVVYELSPPAVGKTAWTETVLVSFTGPNGDRPEAGLLLDKGGNLYGTTTGGGAHNDGVVFELTPPAGGQTAWTERVLHAFSGANGSLPYAGLIADGAGNLYGTTIGGGSHGFGLVYRLAPPTAGETAWTEKVLLVFNGTNGNTPFGNLIADGAGDLYGTTLLGGSSTACTPYGCGTVFELSPPVAGKTAWTETMLQSFDMANGQNPQAGLLADGAGNLYGTTALGGADDEGVVFKVTP